MSEDIIKKFLNEHDYDIRKNKDARWIDQKCTIDVISLISDCILEFTNELSNKEFTVSDIWHSKYTLENVQDLFKKPNPNIKSQNEYDKWFGQPIKLLSYAKILKCRTENRRHYYTVNNRGILNYISNKDRNSFKFLCLYIEKVLKDSEIYYLFDEFFEKQDKNSFLDMKNGYSSFIINNTPINKELECNRIFTKILNPLACKYNKLGTEKGSISSDVVAQNMLLYNQKNWRDIYSEKPKDVERNTFEIIERPVDKMNEYKIKKAKNKVRNYNNYFRNGKTEVYEENHMEDQATQIHHIFQIADFPQIADQLENLIALTPSQHYGKAHPKNNTRYVDREYQYKCLICKIENIKENIINDEVNSIYDFDDLKNVLKIGLNSDLFDFIDDLDFESILDSIKVIYRSYSNDFLIAENNDIKY